MRLVENIPTARGTITIVYKRAVLPKAQKQDLLTSHLEINLNLRCIWPPDKNDLIKISKPIPISDDSVKTNTEDHKESMPILKSSKAPSKGCCWKLLFRS